MAVGDAINKLLEEDRIGTGRCVSKELVDLLTAVELHVDVTSSVQHPHLGQHTAQVSILGHHAVLEVHEISKELLLVLFRRVEKTVGLPLPPAKAGAGVGLEEGGEVGVGQEAAESVDLVGNQGSRS